MKGSPRLSIVIIAGVMAMAACAPTPTPSQSSAAPSTSAPSASPSPSDTVLESIGGISFDRPATWTMWRPNQFDRAVGGPLIYLSTDSLRPTCAVTPQASPHPPDFEGDPCTWPLGALGPNGVLVTWVNTRILQTLPEEGEAIVVNSVPTRLRVDRPGPCKAVEADETIDLLVPIGQPTPLSNLTIYACLRGPNLAAAEAQLRAMLRSTTVTQR
jgi:hypothetical protein